MNYLPYGIGQGVINNPQYVNPFDYSALEPKELFKVLTKYYDNNILYQDIEFVYKLNSKWVENMKGLKSPARRSVEFFASHILKGFEVNSQNEQLKKTVDLILKWSNFSNAGKVAIRQDSLYGNTFFKCMSDGEKVWFELLDPTTIGDNFEVDNKGYIKEIRIDSWCMEDNKNICHTEYYEKTDKDNGYYSVWESEQNNESTKLEELVGLVDSGFLRELTGDNFIPILYCKFSDIGKKLGVGSVEPYLTKIDELNRMATSLHEILFNNEDGLWVISANDRDPSGRPLPAPKPKLATGSVYGTNGDPQIKQLKNVVSMPGMSSIQCLVPDLKYDSILAIVNDQLHELEMDMVELRYNSLSESQLSSKAIRLMLAGAVDKALEARESMLDALTRAIQICLSMGSFFTLPDFLNVGTYQNGNFDEFTLHCDEIFPMSDDEKAAVVKTYKDAGFPLPTAMRLAGFSDEMIKQAQEEKATEDQQKSEMANQNLATAMQSFNSGA